MVVPPFPTKFKNIPTDMTTPANLIQTFGGELFTGLLRVSFNNNHELIGLFEEGSLLGFIEEKEKIRQGISISRVENIWKVNRGIITAYQGYPDEIFILQKLLTKGLTSNLETFGLDLGSKIVALKRKKENCIIEIDTEQKAQAIYLWEGKIIWNLAEKEIFTENKKIVARIYKGKKLDGKKELEKIKKALKELSAIYQEKSKKDFVEDFLFYIHQNLAEKYPIIDPFLGAYELEKEELKIKETKKLSEFTKPFKIAITDFIKKQINLTTEEKEKISKILIEEEQHD